MRSTITRKMTVSTVRAFVARMKEGTPTLEELPALTIMGKADNETALKELRKVHGKDSAITIARIDTDEGTYEIPVSVFMAYAKRID